MKDTEPVDLLRAVRVVGGGEALLSPGVTKRLLEHMAGGLRDRPTSSGSPRSPTASARCCGLVGQGLTNDEIAARLV